ncbi:MAG: SCP2 sterol-binding domain-containing protein [Oscillospiraceae bacterium]|nr:SCP2 sterol-binding domain-containing protein [Oscillospiraceae bacterium]
MSNKKISTVKPSTSAPVATTPAKPAVTAPVATTPAKPAVTAPVATTPAKSATTTSLTKTPAKAPDKKATGTKAPTTKAKSKATVAKPKTTVAKPKAKKVVLDQTDKVKSALWKSANKKKAKKITDTIAIQVFAEGLDSFYIAVKPGQAEPVEIERYYYHDNNGQLQTNEAELLKIASGKCDLLSAVKSGSIKYDGNLWVLTTLIDMFV